MAKNLKGITVEIGGDTTQLNKALEDVNKKTKSLTGELKGVNALLKMDPGNVTLLAQKQDILNGAISETKKKLETLKEAQTQVQEQFDKGEITEEQYRDFQREIVATEKKLESLTDEVKEFGSVGAQKVAQVGEKVQEVGGKVTEFGKELSAVSIGAGAILAGSIASFKELDSGYDTIITKTGATGEALDEINDVADNIFGSMPTDMDTVGTAVGEINTRFAYTGDQLEQLSTQFIQFAEINGVDLNNSIGTVDKVMEQFNLDASETGNVLDLITLKAQQTGIGADTLMNSIQQNGATFKDMGLGVNEAIVLLSQFEANGVNVETALKGLKKASVEYAKDGVTMEQGLAKTIATIKNAKTETQALAEVEKLFGSKGANEMVKAIREGRINIEDLSASMGDYAGVVENTYNATLDPIDKSTVAMNNLKLAGSELGASVQSTFAPLLTALVEKLKSLADWFGNLSPAMQKTIVIILSIVTALAPLTIGIGNIITAVGSIMAFAPKLVTAFNAVKTAFSALGTAFSANPIGIVIVAVTALVGAFIYLWNNCESFRNFWINLWDKIKQIASSVGDWFKNMWSSVLEWFKNAVAKIKDFFSDAWNGIKSVFSGTVIGAYFSAIWNTIKGIFAVVKNVLSGNWSEAWNAIKSIVGGWANYFGTIWSKIKGVFSAVGSWFSTKFTEAKNSIINVFNGIKEKFLNIGKNIVDGIWSGISNSLKWIKGKIKEWVGNVVDFCKKILGIKSPSRLFRDEIGRMIPLGMAQGIDDTKDQVTNSINELVTDTRTEVQKVTDEMNAKLLDSEKKYQEASERLKDSKKDSDKEYLESLKKTAETERKIYDARVKDMENLKKKMSDAVKNLAEETLGSLEEIEKAQEKFADKLKDFGSLTSTVKYNDGDNDFEVVHLADIEAQTQYLQEYYDLLVAVKERGNVPSEFMAILQDMSIEEGRTFAETLLGADDEAFNKYIEDWKIKQETADKLSKLMYADKVDELIDVSQEKFDDLTSKFLLIGESAGKEFENGFLPQILATVNEAISHISRAFASAKIIDSATVITSTVEAVPKMNRGGVLEKGQVGFLEGDGAEAVVPLEKNTGWLNSIADRLNNRMSNNPTESDGALLSKLDKIYDRLDRLQVVLDSNTLVGGIIDRIDSKLNERERLAVRGV